MSRARAKFNARRADPGIEWMVGIEWERDEMGRDEMGSDDMGWVGSDEVEMGWFEIECAGMGRNAMRWCGMGWEGMG